MSSLIDDLMDSRQVLSGKFTLNSQPFDVGQVLSEVQSVFMP